MERVSDTGYGSYLTDAHDFRRSPLARWDRVASEWAKGQAWSGCANKPAEKHGWLICCERKILFRLKKQVKKYGL
jgi:hypothetical protein